MPTLNLNQTTRLYYGNKEVQKLYKGSQELYPISIPVDVTEGLFQYLGTNGRTTTWSNPLINNKFVCQLYDSSGNLITNSPNMNLVFFFDRVDTAQYLYHPVGIGGSIRFKFNRPFKLTKFTWKTSHSGTVQDKNFDIRAWNNDQTFSNSTNLLSRTNLSRVSNTWYEYPVTNNNFYDNYAYVFLGATNSGSDVYLRGSEIEFFGVTY